LGKGIIKSLVIIVLVGVLLISSVHVVGLSIQSNDHRKDETQYLYSDSDGNWPKFHYDERNTGHSSFETTVEVATSPHLIWSYDLPCPVYGSPVVGDVDRDGSKEIFIDNAPIDEPSSGKNGGMLFCLNESGQLMWTFQPYEDPVYPGSWAYSTPTLGDIDQNGYDEILYWAKSQYWPDYYQALYCVDPNGTVTWSSHFSVSELFVNPAADNSVPTIANITDDQWLETVIQYAGKERVTCLNHDGATIWSYYYGWTTEGWDQAYSLHTAPAVADLDGDNSCETLLSISYYNDSAIPNVFKGGVLCVSSTGSLLWSRLDIRPEYYMYPEACSSPTVCDVNDDGFPEVLVGGVEGVYCLNRTGGNEWFYPVAGVFNTAAIADVDADGSKEIVFGADDNYVYCLSSTGSLKWRYLTGNRILSSPAIADVEKPVGGEPGQLEIVVGSLDGRLYCLSCSGHVLWTYDAGAPIYASPAIVNLEYSGTGKPEIVFAASNKIYALRLNTAHDVAIANIAAKNFVGQGYNLPISTTISNKGDFLESVNLTVYANAVKIYNETVTNLQPRQDRVVTFYWNTTGFSLGDYNLGATADPVPEEYHTSDNVLVTGTVKIQAAVHDVAITSILPSQAVIHEGASVTVNITVQNHGNMMESFNVTLYVNETEVAKEELKDLDFGTQETLSLSWNTTSFPKENYVISGTASVVPGEIDVGDNSYVDGAIKLIGEKCVFVNPRVRVISPNATFTVDICAGNVIGLAGWQAFIEFDPEVLTRVTGGSLIGNNTVFYYGLVSPLFTGNKTLFQITFRANAMGDSPLHFRSDTIIADSEGPWSYLTFDGQVKVRIAGDINGDWSVNILDSIILSNAFLATPGSSNWNPNADINSDSVVNILDAITLSNHFLEHYP
jgi:hypothetical protein